MISNEQATIPPGHSWNRIPVIAAACALLGAAGCALLGAANPKQFFFSWLVSFLFFLSLALGALFFVLIQYATQGGWGIVVRRIGETVFATVPVMAVLFVPLLFGLHDLYPWSIPGAAEHDALLRWKAPYLNVPFFLIRAALCFGIWSLIALLYYRLSRSQDATGNPAVSARLRRLAGPAIIVMALTTTFASIDWIVSLTPHWYSTMFGVYFFAGSFVGFIALLSVVAPAMRGAGLLDTVNNPALSVAVITNQTTTAASRSPSFSLFGTRTSRRNRSGSRRGSRDPGKSFRFSSWRDTSGFRFST